MKTLDEVFDLYVKDLKRRKAKTIDSIQAVYQKNISPVLGDKPIDTIIRGDIASLHFDIKECLLVCLAHLSKLLTHHWLNTFFFYSLCS